MLCNVATQWGEYSGLQQYIRGGAQDCGHWIFGHEGPTYSLHVDMTVGTYDEAYATNNWNQNEINEKVNT